MVSNGMLKLDAFQDPAYNDEWVTGGVAQFGHMQTYGAYFARSRMAGAGPTGVELLLLADKSWPPEIDFTETTGVTNGTTATVHWTAANHENERKLKNQCDPMAHLGRDLDAGINHAYRRRPRVGHRCLLIGDSAPCNDS